MELCRVWTDVCVVPVPNYQQKHVGTCLDFSTMKRYKEEIHFRCVLRPVIFQDSVICYKNCSKTRYRSLARFEARPKPKIFHESIVIYPKMSEMTFVSTVEYHIDKCRKWFKTTMEFKAKTYTTTKIQNNINNLNYSKMNGCSPPPPPPFVDSDNNTWTNNLEDSCNLSFSPDEKKALVSNGPGASLIYLPRFEKEDSIEFCNFKFNNYEDVLWLDSSEEEIDV